MLADRLNLVLGLPQKAKGFTPVWPAAAARLLPQDEVSGKSMASWAPILAVLLAEHIAPAGEEARVFEEGQLRSALAETFSGLGIEGDAAWRSAAMVRILIRAGNAPLQQVLGSEAFWTDGDVRWVTGLNEADGKTYVNKDHFEELLTFLQLPSLLTPGRSLAAIEEDLLALQTSMADAAYDLNAFLRAGDDEAPENGGKALGAENASVTEADLKAQPDAKHGAKPGAAGS